MRLNGTDELTRGLSFPLTSEELIEERGEEDIELADGTESVRAVIERLGSETYEDSRDVQAALMNGVCGRAVGRQGYSDRDPFAISESGPEQLSF